MIDLIPGILNFNVMLFYMINNGIDNSVFDFIMPLITNFGSFIALSVVCGLLFIFGGEKGRKVALLGLTALFISNVAVYLLKFLVLEPRPFLTLAHVDLLVHESDLYSFPSGHTASSFAVATVIGLKYKLNINGRKFGLLYPLTIFAGLIGFSRIYIGVHYPYDVIFGALVGLISALLIIKIDEDYLAHKLSHTSLLNK